MAHNQHEHVDGAPAGGVHDPIGAGVVILAATPIGNLEDASPRLRRLLAEADVIAAEDTRRLRRLTASLGIAVTGRVISYNDLNERARAAQLIDAAASGQVVAVVSDAGMPGVSDPGFPLVEAAATAGVRVTALPGPSAVLTALALSGLATDRFCFEGFLPRRPGDRRRALSSLARELRTMIFFEAVHRIDETLESMVAAFGPDRRAAVCRELTKTYEEVRRGPLLELSAWVKTQNPRGEFTIVVAGLPVGAVTERVLVEDQVESIRSRVAAGERLKDVVAEVADLTGLSKKELYAAAVAPPLAREVRPRP